MKNRPDQSHGISSMLLQTCPSSGMPEHTLAQTTYTASHAGSPLPQHLPAHNTPLHDRYANYHCKIIHYNKKDSRQQLENTRDNASLQQGLCFVLQCEIVIED